MSSPLQGKKILIAAESPFYAEPIKQKLEREGAEVTFTSDSPHRPTNVARILEEIKARSPDAVLIHHPNLESREAGDACLAIIKECKDRAVIVRDTIEPFNSRANIPALIKEGALFSSTLKSDENVLVHQIAGAIREHAQRGEGFATGL